MFPPIDVRSGVPFVGLPFRPKRGTTTGVGAVEGVGAAVELAVELGLGDGRSP